MTPKGANLEGTDLLEVSTIESGSYVTRSITGQELIDAIPAPTGFVPTSRTLTINGVAQDLSADRSWTIATGLTIGTTPIASGTIGRVLFQGTGNVLQQSSSLFWDSTNNRLGIGTSTPTQALDISGNINALNSSNSSLELLTLRNSSTGTANQTRIRFFNDSGATPGTNGGMIFLTGNNFSGFPANSFGFWNESGNGVIALATNNTERFRITIGGNVLINTTTDAGFRLDVNGTARVKGTGTTSSTTAFTVQNSAGTNMLQLRDDNYQLFGGWLAMESSRFLYRANNATGILTLCNDSTVASFVNLYGSSHATLPNVLDLGTASTSRLRIAANGNVLINTTTDAGFRLDVNGTARVKGTGATSATTAFTVQNSAGTNTFDVRDDGVATLSRLVVGTVRVNYYNSFNDAFTIMQSNPSTGNAKFYQGVSVGTSSDPVASAILEAVSTTKGFLPPRMTTTQKNAIASPATGLQVFDTTLNQMSYYNGTTWTNI